MMAPLLSRRFPRAHGSTTQMMLIVLCLVALGVIGWMLSLPPALKAKYAPDMGTGFGVGIALILLVMAVLAFLMPLFVWQCAREARRCRELLEEIQAALVRQQEAPMVSFEDPEATTVPIYPPKAGMRTPGRERLSH